MSFFDKMVPPDKSSIAEVVWTLIYNSAAYFLKEGGLEISHQRRTAMVFIKSITHYKEPCTTEGFEFPNGKPSGLQSYSLMYLMFEFLSPDNDHGGGLSKPPFPCSWLMMSTQGQWLPQPKHRNPVIPNHLSTAQVAKPVEEGCQGGDVLHRIFHPLLSTQSPTSLEIPLPLEFPHLIMAKNNKFKSVHCTSRP